MRLCSHFRIFILLLFSFLCIMLIVVRFGHIYYIVNVVALVLHLVFYFLNSTHSRICLLVRSVIAQMVVVVAAAFFFFFYSSRITARNYDFTLYFQQILLPQMQRKSYEKLIWRTRSRALNKMLTKNETCTFTQDRQPSCQLKPVSLYIICVHTLILHSFFPK